MIVAINCSVGGAALKAIAAHKDKQIKENGMYVMALGSMMDYHDLIKPC